MVFCFQYWRCYLEGLQVFTHTDHEPLTWLSSQKSLNRRQSRWMEYLSRFTYSLLYVKGDENVCADTLSRMLQLPLEDAAPLPGDSWPHAEHVNVLDVCKNISYPGLSQAPPRHPLGKQPSASSAWRCSISARWILQIRALCRRSPALRRSWRAHKGKTCSRLRSQLQWGGAHQRLHRQTWWIRCAAGSLK
jgi:hypothetical protein